jgi:glycosyltransferase involved in cell wall biosynthesis
MKKLSIITICFNNAVGLERTLKSVATQTFSDFEQIVIDGGSTDATNKVIEKYTSLISHWVSEKDNGIYNAQNKGLKFASGKYCLFLNAGDYLVNENILASIFNKELPEGIIYGDMFIVFPNGNRTLGKMPQVLDLPHMIGDTLWHPVSFIPRTLFSEFGDYDESLKMVADYDFFLKLIMKYHVKTTSVGIPISVFSLDGVSSDPKNKQQELAERKLVQERYFSQLEISEAQRIYNKRHSKFNKLLMRLGLIKGGIK